MIVQHDECSSSSSGGSGHYSYKPGLNLRYVFPFDAFDVHLYDLPMMHQGCAQDDLSGGYLPAKVVQNVAFQDLIIV